MYDVIALGELLIDFIQIPSDDPLPAFRANPGGAPCNVLAMLAKLGHKTAFLSKVGNDELGGFLIRALHQCGIDATNVRQDPVIPTTLAMVSLDQNHDRSFTFYRNPGADMMLQSYEIPEQKIMQAKWLHFGSISMTHTNNREATHHAIKLAKKHDLLISFDPNYRPLLWESPEAARTQMLYGCGQCDVLKLSEEELVFITQKDDLSEAINSLREQFPIPLILLTLGEKGSVAYYRNQVVSVPAIEIPTPVDTTGAGDTFLGGCLHYLLSHSLQKLTEIELRQMLTFANAAAACVVMRYGALLSMPTLTEIEAMEKAQDE